MSTLTDLMDYQRDLQGCGSVGRILARGADEAASRCGFDRAVVLTVEGMALHAGDTDALSNPASDLLRRSVLRQKIPLSPRSQEAELLRHRVAEAASLSDRPSTIAERLDLRNCVLGAVAPEQAVLGLLVAARASPAVDAADREAIRAHAAALGAALGRRLLLDRLEELALEIRQVTTTAQALSLELAATPLQLPSQSSPVVRFPMPVAADGAPASEILSSRELDVLALLVDGLSNREIAAQLLVSVDTIKARVASILRKLNANNRVEAVARYVRLQSASGTTTRRHP